MSDFSDSSIVVDGGDDEHNEQTDGSAGDRQSKSS